MRYLFCGSFCVPEDEDKLLAWSKCGLQFSIINFQRNMLQGLKENMSSEDTLDIINYYPLGAYGRFSSLLFLSGERDKNYQRLSLLNIPIIKQLFYNIQAWYYINRWVKTYKDEEKCILMYDLLTPYLKVLSSLPSINLKTISIVADLPNEYGYYKSEKGLKARIKEYIGRRSLIQIGNLDRLGLLTRQMSEVLKLRKDQYVVIEGFSNGLRPFCELSKSDQTIVLQTGVVSKTYQLDTLIEAFGRIHDSSFELWICGNGNYVEELLVKSKKDRRIKYLGNLPASRIAEIQSRATILINPRQNIGAYTKYSFPSKIIEYLSTARPVIGYRLDGIPDEYYDYIRTPNNNSIDELANTIVAVSQMPYSQLKQLGIEGRKFVIKRCNPREQISKLLSL